MTGYVKADALVMIPSFSMYIPTRVYFGRGCLKQGGPVLAGTGSRAFIVTGPSSARACGALDDIVSLLDRLGMAWMLFDRVGANPSVESARGAAALCRSFHADMVIAAGGGSPIDLAKAVAVLAGNDVPDDDLFGGRFAGPVLPVAAIPTTAGTGSEVTPYSILTDPSISNKRNLRHDGIFPRWAFIDPAYTDSLPIDITRNTALDALSHAVEGFLSSRSTPPTDIMALEAAGILGPQLRGLADAVPDPAARDDLMYASFLAGCVIAVTGTTVLHAMGYHLTYFHGVEHGRANALLMEAYLRYLAESGPADVDRIISAMGFDGIGELGFLLGSLAGKMPALTPGEIGQGARTAAGSRGAACTVPCPSAGDIEKMFRLSLGVAGSGM